MKVNKSLAEYSFYKVADLEELQQGGKLFFEINGQPIVLINIDGEFYAISDKCTHDDGPIGDGVVEGLQIVCPRHGARFDIGTGKALTLPAVKNLPVFPVKIVGNDILLGIPFQTS